MLLIPQRHADHGLILLAKPTKCANTQMVIIIVRNEDQVDSWETIEWNAGPLQARCDEANGPIVVGIRQNVHTVDLDENGGVIDDGNARLHPAPCLSPVSR